MCQNFCPGKRILEIFFNHSLFNQLFVVYIDCDLLRVYFVVCVELLFVVYIDCDLLRVYFVVCVELFH